MTLSRQRLVLFILGPTGSGKTALSIHLSRQQPVEIVSADSRQIYRYLDIGTAKPSPEILQQIPHHFIDILDPDHSYSAGRFGEEARRVIREILQREAVPVVVGGSGLYIRALLQGFFQRDVKAPEIRKMLNRIIKEQGLPAAYAQLLAADPDSAAKIHPNNTSRIVRALEVFLATGQPLSRLQRNAVSHPDFYALKVGIAWEREQLYQRINQRVEEMFGQGLIEEVEKIIGLGYDRELNSLNTVGYREVLQYLEGKTGRDECMRLVQQNSRNYAKRQLTWFRRDNAIRWYQVGAREDLEDVAQQVKDLYQETVTRPDPGEQRLMAQADKVRNS